MMESIKNLIGSRGHDKPLAEYDKPQSSTYHHDDNQQMHRSYDHDEEAVKSGGGGEVLDYGGTKESHLTPMTATPMHTPSSPSNATLSMADLQKQIDSTQGVPSSAYSTPMATRKIRTVLVTDHEQKYPPIVKESEAEGEGMKKGGGTIDDSTNDLSNKSNEPTIRIESIYTGPMKTAYGHGYSEGYKRAMADLQGHAGKGVIEYPNPSVYKLLTEEREKSERGASTNADQPLSMTNLSVARVGHKTKSFFIRVLEKLGCTSSEADRDRESTMEFQQNPATKKNPSTTTSATRGETKRAEEY